MRSFIKRYTRGTSSDYEWYNQWQLMTISGTTNDNELQKVAQRVTTCDNDNEWQRITMSDTTSDDEW